jgi:hypothetical protein
MPKMIKAYIQHIPKENSTTWENNSKRDTKRRLLEKFKQNIKDISKEPEFLYKVAYKVYLYKGGRRRLGTTKPSYQLRHQKEGVEYQASQR